MRLALVLLAAAAGTAGQGESIIPGVQAGSRSLACPRPAAPRDGKRQRGAPALCSRSARQTARGARNSEDAPSAPPSGLTPLPPPTHPETCCDRIAWRSSNPAACVACAGDVITVRLPLPAPGAANATVGLFASPSKPGWTAGALNLGALNTDGCDARVASPIEFSSPSPSELALALTAAAGGQPCTPGTCTTAPAPSPRGTNALAVGRTHACALRSDGSALCSGYNQYMQAGRVASLAEWFQSTPIVAFPALVQKAVSISIGGSAANGSTIVATAGGSVIAFGANNFGQVGQEAHAVSGPRRSEGAHPNSKAPRATTLCVQRPPRRRPACAPTPGPRCPSLLGGSSALARSTPPLQPWCLGCLPSLACRPAKSTGGLCSTRGGRLGQV
jgi:hypothetical protein